MTLFRTALGPDWDRLHPQLRRRFDIAAGATAVVGTGVMDEVWRGPAFTLPFLALGTRRHIGFPDTGRGVAFAIENFAYRDRYGREAVTFVRTFEFPHRRRRFDATMAFSPERGVIVDYLGTHQHLATDLALRVDEDGGLHIRTGPQRFRAGPVDTSVPGFLLGVGEVHESYDEQREAMRIDVRVTSPRFGPLFGYRGTFTVRTVDDTVGVPAGLLPAREELRG